jgi:hypothetical protein
MATTCFGPLVAIIRYTAQKLKEGVKVEASRFLHKSKCSRVFKKHGSYGVCYSLYGNNIVYYMLSLIYFIGPKLLCVEPLFFTLKVINLVEIYIKNYYKTLKHYKSV